MREVKQYDWESVFDFGYNRGKTIKEVFESSPSYINWCLQKVDWFCLTDEIFEEMPNIIFLRKNKNLMKSSEKDWLKILTDIHIHKKEELNSENPFLFIENDQYDNNMNYENPWIEVFGEGEEADTAYWNTE